MAPIGWCRTCAICKRRCSRSNDTKRKFMSKFPRDEDRCRQWVKMIGNEDFAYIPIEKLHQVKYVCGDHFQPKDFNKKGSRLKKWAVPSLLINAPPLPDHLLAEFPYHIARSMSASFENAQCTATKISAVEISPIGFDHNYCDLKSQDKNQDYSDVPHSQCLVQNETVMDGVILVPTNPGLANAMDDETKPLMICRVCLSTTRRVYSLHALRLAATYSALSGVTLHERGRGLPQAACAACAARLRSARQLSERSQRANELLIGLLEKTFKITPEAVNELHLDDPILTVSTLVPVNLEPDHCDLYIKEEVQDQDNLVAENVGEIVEAAEVVAEELEYFNSEDPLEGDETTEEEETKDFATEPPEDQVKTGELVRRYFGVQKLSLPKQILEAEKAQLSFKYLESKYKCDMCFKVFISEATFSAHVATHCKLTLGEIQRFDREQLRLTDNLHYSNSDPIHVDRYYVHNPEENVINDIVKLELDVVPLKCDDFNDIEEVAEALNNKHILETDVLHDDLPATNDLSNSDDELDVLIQSHKKAKTTNKTKATVSKTTKEKKTVASKKTVAGEKVKLTRAKTKRNTSTARSKAKTKLAEPKVSKTKKLKDTETERKMEEHFTVAVFKTLEEKLEELQKRKTYLSYVNAPLKCEFCFRGYLDNETYDVHMQKHTEKHGEFLCEVCHLRFPTKILLRRHVFLAHLRKFFCRTCSFESHGKYQAMLHMRFHEGKKYKCTHCDKVFNHRVHLNRHIRGKHPTDSVCPLCGYSFLSAHGLATHSALLHRHQSAQIPDDGPACTACDIRFASDVALQTHRKVSSKHGKSQENIKKRDYKALYRMLKPMKPTTFEDPVPCEKKHTLKDHMLNHTEGTTFRCDTCGKSFCKRSKMLMHSRVHLGVRYPCTVCGKLFSFPSNRDRHFKTAHTESKDFNCEFCSKCFKNNATRKLHTNHVHLHKPYPKRNRNREGNKKEKIRED